MDKLLKKTIFGTAIFLICTLLNLYMSTLLHFQLKYGGFSVAKISPMACFMSIAVDEKHRVLFLSLNGVTLLMIAAFIFCQLGRSYESSLYEVTPKIKTPVKAGQNQHGSACWLSKKKFSRCFSSNIIYTKSEIIKELMKVGYEDLDFVRKEARDGNEREENPVGSSNG